MHRVSLSALPLLLVIIMTPSVAPAQQTGWVQVCPEAAFSRRDTAEDAVFLGKMWLSNAYNTEGKLTRDLWTSEDAVTWTKVLDETASALYLLGYDRVVDVESAEPEMYGVSLF